MICSYFGPNALLLKIALNKRVTEFTIEHGEFAVEAIDAEETDISKLQEATQNPPFLTPKKLVVIHHIAKNKQLTESIQHMVEQVPDGIDVLFVESYPDKRTSWYKYLLKSTKHQVFDLLSQPQLLTWIKSRAEEFGSSIESKDALMLIERTGIDMQMIDKALEKMSVLEGPITSSTITLHVEPILQSTVFELLDATLSGQIQKSLQLYDGQRRQKVEPQAVWAMLLWQLHVLAVVLSSGSRSQADIAKESNISPYVISKALALTKRIKMNRLKELVHLARNIDVRFKNEPIDVDEVVRYVLVAIAN